MTSYKYKQDKETMKEAKKNLSKILRSLPFSKKKKTYGIDWF